jgi:hypothetical protein
MPALSIDPLPSLRLSYRRADVAAFWMVSTTLVFAGAAAIANAIGAAYPLAWGGTAGALMLLPGLLGSRWFEAGIWVWNGVNRRSAAYVRRYVSAVCYYTLFAAVGRSGGALAPAAGAPHASGWSARPDRGRHGNVERTSNRLQWYGSILATARNRRNAWVLWLAPVVFLLALFRDEFLESAPPSSTYTLY